MYRKTGRRIVVILIITLVSLYISLPNIIPVKINYKDKSIVDTVLKKRFLANDLKLGLDLIGGSYLVFEVNTSDISLEKRADALSSLKDVMEKRVNLFGIAEPNIQLSSFEGRDRIIVELPGVRDTKEAIELIGKTAQLTFAEVVEPAEEGEEASLAITDLTGADLIDSEVGFDQVSGKPMVVVRFNDEGKEKFSKLTEKNINKPLPIILDGQVISAPVVQDKIDGGTAQISGDFTLDEAKDLSIQLNAGALPASVELISERTVGATLGRESVEKSVRAGVVGLLFVLVFMAVFYGKLGLVADIGLIIFGLITLSLYKLIPVVLTLPGIAGFLLSVGMAVDSNILIFERFREERRGGVNIIYALETSFDRAWDSIKDANIATLLTAFVLANPLNWNFLHTSGPVRGFAITLALGIGISLFTGIFVSRNLLRYFIRERSDNK